MKKGFTLMELLTVILIMALLAGFLFPSLQQVRTRARVAKAKAEMNSLRVALTAFYAEEGGYPTNKDTRAQKGATGSETMENGLEKLAPPNKEYLSGKVPEDPFSPGRIYRYYTNVWGTNSDFGDSWIIFSLGPDRKDNIVYNPGIGKYRMDWESVWHDSIFDALMADDPNLDKSPQERKRMGLTDNIYLTGP